MAIRGEQYRLGNGSSSQRNELLQIEPILANEVDFESLCTSEGERVPCSDCN